MTTSALLSPAHVQATNVVFPSGAIQQLQAWAIKQPSALALLHKQHGRWQAYRWGDLPATLERLQHDLLKQGLVPGVRLALAGALTPELILLALAAQAVGAVLVSIDRDAQGEQLKTLLQAAQPGHAFVQDRKTIASWLASGYSNAAPLPLLTSQMAKYETSSWRILPLHGLISHGLASFPHGLISLRRSLKQRTVSWVDEGTEWQAGLAQVVKHWLNSGHVLASPETGSASSRDRREIQPHMLLASPARQLALQQELEQRLPASGSWRRYVIERGRGDASSWLGRWLLGRVAYLHGLPLQHDGWGTSRGAAA